MTRSDFGGPRRKDASASPVSQFRQSGYPMRFQASSAAVL